MLLHMTPRFVIYFGDAQDKLMQADYLNLPDAPILELESFSKLKHLMHVQQLFFAHQVHGVNGVVVDEKLLASVRPFKTDADCLITELSHVGVGVMSADCLPIVLHDKVKNVVAIAHAGWRGAVQGVVVKTVERMQEIYGSRVENITAFFGPSAKICCYQVAEDFKKNLEGFVYADRFIQQHGEEWYFDLPGLNKMQLEVAGIKKEALHLNYNVCTMCDDSFYSHRRQGEKAGRQMTVVSLT